MRFVWSVQAKCGRSHKFAGESFPSEIFDLNRFQEKKTCLILWSRNQWNKMVDSHVPDHIGLKSPQISKWIRYFIRLCVEKAYETDWSLRIQCHVSQSEDGMVLYGYCTKCKREVLFAGKKIKWRPVKSAFVFHQSVGEQKGSHGWITSCTTDKWSTSIDIFIRLFVWKPQKRYELSSASDEDHRWTPMYSFAWAVISA